MLSRSLSLARLTALGVLVLGLSMGCGGGSKPPPAESRIPDATRSTVLVEPGTELRANGQDAATLTVTVRDAGDRVLQGVSVELQVPEGGATVTPSTALTNASGTVSAVLKATGAGVKTVRILVRGDGGTVELATRPSVTFLPVAKQLVFTAEPGNQPVRTRLQAMEVRVVDFAGNRLADSTAEVTLALQGGTPTLRGTTTVRAVEGVARFDTLFVDDEGRGLAFVATAEGLEPATSAAFDILDTQAPAAPVLAAVGATTDSITVQWDAVGDDGAEGRAMAYDLRYATHAIDTVAQFEAATRFLTNAPQDAGARESVTLTGLSPGTAYFVALKVTDSAANATYTARSLQVSTLAAGGTRLAFQNALADGVAGEPLGELRVAELDASGAVVTSATPLVTLVLLNEPTVTWTAQAVDGVARFTDLRLTRTGTYAFRAYAGARASEPSQPFSIRAAAPSTLDLVSGGAIPYSGSPVSVDVMVLDAFGNLATDYTGTVRFTSSDAAAELPAPLSFNPVHRGQRRVSVTMMTSGAQTLSATDGTRSDSLALDVEPGSTATLSLSGLPATVTADSEQTLTVTALDARGNIASRYTGTVVFTSSDAQAELPPRTDFRPEDGGRKTFRVRLRTAGSLVTVRVTDMVQSTFNALATTSVVAGPPYGVALTVPEQVTAGQAFAVTVTVKDAFGNRAVGYTGTVGFTATGSGSTLPPQTAFTVVDAGRKTFSGVVLRVAGTSRLTVTDTASASMSVTAPLSVVPAAPARLAFSAQPRNGRVRTPLDEVRVSLLDAFDNPTMFTGRGVVLTLSGSGGGTLGGSTVAVSGNGVASFGSLVVDAEGQGYTLRAAAVEVDSVLSTPFDIVDDMAPAKPVLGVESRSVSVIEVGWDAVGDDGQSGKAAAYELRYATTPIVTDADFAAAVRVDTELPQAPGTRERARLKGLEPATAYHVALRVTDGAGNATRSDTLTVSTTAFQVARLAFTGQPVHTPAGQPLPPVEVTLLDAEGNTATTSSDPVTLTFGASPTVSLTVSAVKGVATFSGLVFQRASTGNTLQATSGSLPAVTSAAFDIRPAAAVGLVLSGLTSQAEAGQSLTGTVTAYDGFGNVATGYTGTVHVTSTDGAAVLPGPQVFTQADAGRKAFTVSLRTAGVREVQVEDAAEAAMADAMPVVVVASSAVGFSVAGGAGPLEVGTPFSLDVTARDAFGNVATGYVGTVHFTASDARAVLPTGTPFTAADRGHRVFTGVALRTSGHHTVSVADGAGVTGTFGLELTPGPASTLELVADTLTPVAGQPFGLAVTARDAYGNVATGYAGTVRFASGDARASLPADTAFTAANAGTRRFEATLRTAGDTRLDVRDTVTVALAGGAGLQVRPDVAARLAFLSQPSNGSVRMPLADLRVAVQDAYDNTVLGQAPTVQLALSGGDPSGRLQGNRFVSPVDGVATFSGVSVDREATAYQLTASAPGLTSASSTAFVIVDDIAPAAPVLTVEAVADTSITLRWNATGDDGLEGMADWYEVRYSTAPITNDATWDSATQVARLPAPQPGSSIGFTVGFLEPETTYYLGAQMLDGAGNRAWAAVSATTTVRPNPCEDVVCETPAPTCTPDFRGVVTYHQGICADINGEGVCQSEVERTTRCDVGRGCSDGLCVPFGSSTQAGRIIVTELRILGRELIELHNTTSSNLDIRGFQLENSGGLESVVDIRATTDLGGANATPVVVPPGGYVFGVANPADGVLPAGVGFVYGAPGTDFSLRDTGDALVLSDRNGWVEDAIDFRNFGTDPDVPLLSVDFVGFAGGTTQLDSSRLTAVGNDAPGSWCITFYPGTGPKQRVSDTAGAANGSCKVAVINEVLIDSADSDDATSFIEIAGPGGALVEGAQIIDLEGHNAAEEAGQRNTDGDFGPGELDGIFVIPAGVRIPADGILLIADRSPALGGNTQVPGFVPGVDVLAEDVDFEGGGRDAIQLTDLDGVLLDTVGTDPQGEPLFINRAFNNLPLYETATALYPPVNATLARSTLSADTGNNRADFHGDPTPTPGRPNDAVNVTITGITPNNGLASTAHYVVITGTDLAFGSGIWFGSDSQSASCNVAHDATAMYCTVPGNNGIAARVDVRIRTGESIAPEVTVPGGFAYTAHLNDTGNPDELDYCNLQWPPSLTVRSGETTQTLYMQVYEQGLTDIWSGQAPGIRAELGFGPLDSDPRSSPSWSFFPAPFNVEVGNNDEYMGTLPAPEVIFTTHYSYTVRYTRDTGVYWTYCDLNGAGLNEGLVFEPTQLGVMTVTP
jgi:hypothetical protein